MKAVLGALLTVFLAACGPNGLPNTGGSPAPAPSAAASPSPAPPPAASPPACLPIAGGSAFPGGGPRPSITDVRAATHGTYDRLVIEFSATGLPAYELTVNPGEPPGGTTFMTDARGELVQLAGAYGLLLKLAARPAAGPPRERCYARARAAGGRLAMGLA